MRPERNIYDLSRAFAIRVVRLAQFLRSEFKEYALADQVIRSGTSIAANVREAQDGCSRADFINKMNIALKEANETLFWLDLLHETDYLEDALFVSMEQDCRELYFILTAICKTSRRNSKS